MSGSGKGYTLPTVIDPDRVCVQVVIPNDLNHILAFWGQLWELTYWNNWQRDPTKKGKEAAAVWLDVYKTARAQNAHLDGCEGSMGLTDMRVQDCVLQVKYDGSDEWVSIGSLASCAPPQTRVRIEDCTLQESLDAGDTWQDRGEIDCGSGGGSEPTELQVVDCQIQTRVGSAGDWENVPGGAFYPLDASCPAIAFRAQSDIPYTSGGNEAGDTSYYRLGLVPSDDIWLIAYNRRLALRWGADIEHAFNFDVDGRAEINNIPGSGSPQNGFVFENNGDLYLQKGLWFRDYGEESSSPVVSSIQAARVSPTGESYIGQVDWFAHDYTGTKTLISGGIEAAAPKLGVLGALPVARQVISGSCDGNSALKQMIEAFASFGWVQDETELGEVPDVDPNAPAFLEAQRCRVARGGINFLIEQYTEAVNICCDEGILDVTIKVSEVQGRLVYLQANATDTGFLQTDFEDWVYLVTNSNMDCDLAYSSLSAILDARGQIQQLYYCALDPDGTLSPLGYETFMLALAGDTGMPTAEAEAFALFCSYFLIPSWAMMNSHGYFLTNPDDCTFDSCDPDVEGWSMNWHWSLNQGDPAWQFENGTYTPFQGWTQTSISSALVMTIQNSISGFMMHFDANGGDQVQVVVIDRETGNPLAIEGGVAGVGDFEISWQAADESEWAISGVDVRLTSADLTDFDGFTNAKLIHSCMSGFGLSPEGGEAVGSCI